MPFLVIAIWMVCFWEKLVTLLPFTDQVLIVLTQAPEVIIYFGALWMQASRSTPRGTHRTIGYGLDALLVAFLGWIVLSSAIAQSAAGPFASPDSYLSFLNIKALVRYFAVFFLVTRIEWDARKVATLRNTILAIVAIQAGIGMLQIVFGRPALELFSPRSLTDTFGLDRDAFVDREMDTVEIFGTFRNTISYAYLMMIGMLLVLVSKVRIGPAGPRVLSAFLLIMIFFSGSRIVLLVAGATYAAYFFKLQVGRLSRAKITGFLVAGFFLVAVVYSYLLSLDLDFDKTSVFYIVTPGYIDAAMNGRLGVMFIILPQLINNWQFFVGYGADWTYIVNNLIQSERIANFALVATLEKTIEDVYWVALLLYYGVIGMVFFILFQAKLYKRMSDVAQRHGGWIAETTEIARLLFLVSLALNFVNQAYEVQILALVLWTMCAVSISAARQAEARARRSPTDRQLANAEPVMARV